MPTPPAHDEHLLQRHAGPNLIAFVPDKQPGACGTPIRQARSPHTERVHHSEAIMGKGLLLWLIGIPLPIILLIWAFGGLS
jgi:hypothetical protein